ncbi:kinesin [Chloropicon primus]|nr:kinesin [Chloropicon primus]
MTAKSRPGTARSRPGTARGGKGQEANSNSNGEDAGVNVQVILRCRPISGQEKAQRLQQVVKCCEATREVTVTQQIANKQIGRTFTFDRVFGKDTTQANVYDAAITPIVSEVLDGFNCTIFAYGQTGTGKTYTMGGDIERNAETGVLDATAGVIPRAIKQIFETLESAGSEYSVKVSYLELYNEKITDLLGIGEDHAEHQLCEDGRGGVIVRGLEDEIVKTSEEIFEVLERGTARRKTAETKLNKESSRSHSVFTVTIHIKETTPEGDEMIKCGKLNLVDLAGSENISRSGAKKERAREAGEINKSLLTLGRVISALVERQSHIPYRDSKLTRLLRDSLGGKTKTCIIATIAPTALCLDETLNTLDYAQRAKSIKNRPEVNRKISKTTLIKDLTVEIDRLKADLIATREKNGIYLSNAHHESLLTTQKELQEQVQSLETQIEEKEEELKNVKEMFLELETSHDSLSKAHDETKRDLQTKIDELDETCEALEVAKTGIEERDYLIAAHEQAEDRIVSHAIEITDNLTCVTDDTYKLHNKLERKGDVEKSNLAVVRDLQSVSAGRISQFQELMSKNIKVQNDLLKDSSKAIDGLLEEQDANLSSLSCKISNMKSDLESFSSKAVSLVQDEFVVKAGGVLNEVLGMEESNCQSTTDMGQNILSATTKDLGKVKGAVEKSKELLESYSTQQRENSEDIRNKTSEVSEAAEKALVQVKSTTSACQKEAASAYDALKKKLGEAQERMMRSLAEQQNEMISTLTRAVNDSMDSQKSMVQSFFAEMTGDIDATYSSMNASLDGIEEVAEDGNSQLSSMQKQHEKEIKKNEKATAKIEKSFEKSLDKCETLCTEVEQAVEQNTNSLSDAQQKHAQEVAAMLEGAQAGMKEAMSGIEDCIAAGQSTLDKSMSEASGLFADITNSEKDCLQRVADITAEHSKSANENAEKSLELVSDLGKSIDEHAANVKPDASTGETPAKRTIDLPQSGYLESLRTPAPELVLEEFRMQKETRGTQTPVKEETASELEDVVEQKENEDECLGTPAKTSAAPETEILERSPLAAVTNSPSIGLCN